MMMASQAMNRCFDMVLRQQESRARPTLKDQKHHFEDVGKEICSPACEKFFVVDCLDHHCEENMYHVSGSEICTEELLSGTGPMVIPVTFPCCGLLTDI